MTVHFVREIEKLKKKILSLGAMVENTVDDAVTALLNRDIGLAKKIIDDDYKIDDLEVEVEEECLKILALHQPVAKDLRYVIASLKINNDLERMADMAVNIAESSIELAGTHELYKEFSFQEMAKKSRDMLRGCLDALINSDAKLARHVCAIDDEVDDMHAETFQVVENLIKANPDKTSIYTRLLSISRYLERIADLATNISEDVIYMVEGQIARHDKEKLKL